MWPMRETSMNSEWKGHIDNSSIELKIMPPTQNRCWEARGRLWVEKNDFYELEPIDSGELGNNI